MGSVTTHMSKLENITRTVGLALLFLFIFLYTNKPIFRSIHYIIIYQCFGSAASTDLTPSSKRLPFSCVFGVSHSDLPIINRYISDTPLRQHPSYFALLVNFIIFIARLNPFSTHLLRNTCAEFINS